MCIWRMRWMGLQAASLGELPIMERLADVSRPGRPFQITAEQTRQIVAIACEQPKERPISQCVEREIADEKVARGIFQQISPCHATGLFKKGPQIATDPLLFAPPVDELRDEKVKAICALYQEAPNLAE